MEKTEYKEESWVYYSPTERRIYYFYRDKLFFSIEVNEKIEEILRAFGSKYLIFNTDALISVLLVPDSELVNKILSNPRFENKTITIKDIKEMIK